MHWITLWLVLFFGTLTLVLHDPVFIMWKPTVINWAFAAALLFSHWFMKRGLIARMLDAVASFPDLIIQRLTYAWTFFLISLGALNLYVAFNFDEATWVNFKLFGLMGLTLVFALGQGLYLARHMPENQQS
jgi:intracellular septation protein